MTSVRFFRSARASAKRGSASRSGRPRRAVHGVDVAVRLEAGEEEPATVLRPVRVHERRLVGMPRLGLGHLADGLLEAEVPPEHVGPGPEQRHLDHAPAPGLPLLEHRGQQAGQGGQPADVVPDAAAGVERHALAVGQLDGQARAGPEGADVVGGAVAVLAAQAVPADAAVDEARMAGHRGRGLEPEAIERVGAQVGEEDVGRRQQLLQPLPGLRLAQVEDDAALAPVVLGERRVREVLADAEGAEGTAHRVAVAAAPP